jgi:hypothetical protein
MYPVATVMTDGIAGIVRTLFIIPNPTDRETIAPTRRERTLKSGNDFPSFDSRLFFVFFMPTSFYSFDFVLLKKCKTKNEIKNETMRVIAYASDKEDVYPKYSFIEYRLDI